MLDEWASLYNYKNVYVLNMDVGSNDESKEEGNMQKIWHFLLNLNPHQCKIMLLKHVVF